MKRTARWFVAGAVIAVAGLAYVVGSAYAADNTEIRKISELVKKGDMAGAKKLADAYAKKHTDLDEMMHAFKPAKKGGIGVEPTGDGIEQVLIKIGRDAPTAANVAKGAAGYEQAGYDLAALALITEAFAPAKDSGKKTRKDWVEWSKQMGEQGLKLAAAGKAKSAADLKTAASKANGTCNNCHSIWR